MPIIHLVQAAIYHFISMSFIDSVSPRSTPHRALALSYAKNINEPINRYLA
jgi:hypothetical protein